MTTTPNAILVEASQALNETSTDTSSKRVGYFNSAVRTVLGERKWSWSRKSHTLDTDDGIQEYDLSSEISDFDPERGIYEVYLAGVKIDYVEYSEKDNVSSENARWYWKPDGKTIGFTTEFDGTENVVIWYYAIHTNAANSGATLNIPIPEKMHTAIVLQIKALVHNGKRQRYDARNALLDYKEEIEKRILGDASNKGRDVPKVVNNVMRFFRFRRNYNY